jgi:hypothetical protein
VFNTEVGNKVNYAQIVEVGGRARTERRSARPWLCLRRAMRLLVCASSLGIASACTDDDSQVGAKAEDPNASAIEKIEVYSSNIAEGLVVEGTVHLGTIELGQVGMDGIHCRFHVKNMTESRLERVRLIPSCGCTQAVAMQESIAPGETLTVDVRLSPRVVGEQWSEVGILATPADRTDDRMGEQAPALERPVARMRISWMGAARFRLALASSAVGSEGVSSPARSTAETVVSSSSSTEAIAHFRVVAIAPSGSSAPSPLVARALAPLPQAGDKVRVVSQTGWQSVRARDGSVAPGVWTSDLVLALEPRMEREPNSLDAADSAGPAAVVAFAIQLADDRSIDGLGTAIMLTMDSSGQLVPAAGFRPSDGGVP